MPKIGNKIGVQYSSGSSSAIVWVYVTLGNEWYRKGRRGDYYVLDYSSDGGINWELNINSVYHTEDVIFINIDQPGGVEGYRQEVRDGAYKIDKLTDGGSGLFTGVEGIDWENTESYQG